MTQSPRTIRALAVAGILAVAAGAGGWIALHRNPDHDQVLASNGRIEATEIDIAAKLGGRLADLLVAEGDWVEQGQVLGHMQLQTLEAQQAEAQAQRAQADAAIDTAQAQVAMREGDAEAARAQVVARSAEMDAARRRLARSTALAADGAASQQELDDDGARMRGATAAVDAAAAQVGAADAAVRAARQQVLGARATAKAVAATVARIQAEIADNALLAPRAGRVQYRIVQPGEVLPAGGKVLNMVDLSDVYMTFFVPEQAAGRLALGDEVRLVLDAAPRYVVPARVSFVSSAAQFTPKSVETTDERQKLMFRVRARIPADLLRRYRDQVKTGVPGIAWTRLRPDEPWPQDLAERLPAP